ncbi:PorT family protein [Prevotella sp. E13-17]|uniref:porin family protein n=1 Tax=Prevotella sp. E13-17 TaxID=2913616 RepID=UPI001EDBA669|nr:porin family protein [Prevotella sp. E13-17]UKK49927.1 PorT family protein [Prevotella sp. E13-17]
MLLIINRKVKRFSLLIALLALTSAVKAQIGDYRNEFSIGFNGGYVLSNVGFTPTVPQSQHTGLTGGLTLRYTSEKYFNSICAVVAEVNYTQLGWKEDIKTPEDELVVNTVTGLAESYQRDMTYLQIPVFARLGWGRERRGLQFFFQAGPQIGVFLNEKTQKNFEFKDINIGSRTSTIIAQDTMSVEHKVDYGIAAGLGLELSIPHAGHLLLEGRYYYGLGDIYGNSKHDYFARSNISNIVIKMTYLFDLVKSKNSKIK